MVTMLMMAEVASKHPRKRSDGSVKQTVSLHLDPDLLLLPSRNPRPLHNASISPWTYNTSRDESLYPPVLSEAHCLLKGCRDLEGKEDQNLQSRPIWYQVMVLKRVKTNETEHSYHYRLETRNVPVGCTCVRHLVHVQE
ncbi:interleukin 17a/f1 isoform X2 [Poecilia latipinna]|nr:PREDICTED: interleukin-17F-like isoform X2 [Poecilia latipinna]